MTRPYRTTFRPQALEDPTSEADLQPPLPPSPPLMEDDLPEEEENGCGWRLLSILLLLTALGLGGLWGVHAALSRGWVQQLHANYSGVALLPGPLIRPGSPDVEIQIYYLSGDRALDYRTCKLRRAPAGDAERVDLIREALNNPVDPQRFHSPLPDKTKIRAAYILDGVVWLDLSKEFQQVKDPTPLKERLTVYALVNTFLLNSPDLQGVRIMIEGQPVQTAWGWLDLGEPLGVNLSLIG